MAEQYRICIIAPPGYVHASCFVEVAWLLAASLKELGIDCDAKLNELDRKRTNILLGSHLLTYRDQLKQYRYIPYQLEQLSANEGAWNENLRLILTNATAVWDYSAENIAFLAEKGITAKQLPVGYHPILEHIPIPPIKDVDVLFYGSLGGRRKPLLDSMVSKGKHAIKTLFGVYGEERDAWIGRSKIVLNIHYYDAKIFEAVRISYLLNNKVFVLSEESAVNPYPGVTIAMTPYDSIEQKVSEHLSNEAERERLRLESAEQFRKLFLMTRLIESVLKD